MLKKLSQSITEQISCEVTLFLERNGGIKPNALYLGKSQKRQLFNYVQGHRLFVLDVPHYTGQVEYRGLMVYEVDSDDHEIVRAMKLADEEINGIRPDKKPNKVGGV